MAQNPTVFAVVTVTVEVHVRASGADEKLSDLYRVAEREAGAILDSAAEGTKGAIRLASAPKFSHAVVRMV